MKNKYRAKKITINGETFDSKKEWYRYQELKRMEKHGEIKDLQRQVKFVVIPMQREPDTVGKRGGIKAGKLIEREASYIADFSYYVPTGDGYTQVVEDTKGFRTKDYILKRKLMLWVHGIQIKEV